MCFFELQFRHPFAAETALCSGAPLHEAKQNMGCIMRARRVARLLGADQRAPPNEASAIVSN
jgi:hypothetical protein